MGSVKNLFISNNNYLKFVNVSPFMSIIKECNNRVKNKDCKFNNYITHVLHNIDEWNKKVKKEHNINESDSASLIERKVYRQLNENDSINLQVEAKKAKYRRHAELY